MNRRTFLQNSLYSTLCSASLFSLARCLHSPDNSSSQSDLYAKFGFSGPDDYQQNGAPFVKGPIDDWQSSPNLSAARKNALDLVIELPGKPPHYLMGYHSGMVKAALQKDVVFPSVDVLLHIDAHIDTQHIDDSGLDSGPWLSLPPQNGTAVEINSYAESDATETGWIRTFAYLYNIKEIVFLTHGPMLNSMPAGTSATLYVVTKSDSQSQTKYGITFSQSIAQHQSVQVVREISWQVVQFCGTADSLSTIINNRPWAFSICNDVYLPDWYEGDGQPIDNIKHVQPLIDVLKQLPVPRYGCTNISPDYTKHPDSLESSRYFHKHYFETS